METKLLKQDFFKHFRRRSKEKYFSNTLSDSNKIVCKNIFFSNEDKIRIVVEGQSGMTTIDKICCREGILPAVFNEWTQDFLMGKYKNIINVQPVQKQLSDDERYRIVLEGNNGSFSIAEICKNESVTHDEFLQWSEEFLQISEKRKRREKANDSHTLKIKELIKNFVGEDILIYFESFIDVTSKKTIVITDYHKCSKDNTLKNKSNLVCLSRVNDIRNINKYFELINSKLPQDGIFIGCLESLTLRRERITKNGIPILNYLYLGYEFLLKRLVPKLNLTKNIYFKMTKGKDSLLSEAEVLGRLVKNGFKIMDLKSIEGLMYFVVKKEKEPIMNLNPSYGLIYKTPRLSKNGRIIQIYKFRTMHPYSEYLHDYVLKINGYAKSGKPANDFRIPTWGKIMRKIWIDELPQLINVLRGELKLVGVRPVSERYFKDIPKEMQKLRLTQKPGCIPPYISLNNRGDIMSVLQSEKEYLEEKIKHPYITDIKYFFKAIFNIVFRNMRSA